MQLQIKYCGGGVWGLAAAKVAKIGGKIPIKAFVRKGIAFKFLGYDNYRQARRDIKAFLSTAYADVYAQIVHAQRLCQKRADSIHHQRYPIVSADSGEFFKIKELSGGSFVMLA